MARRVEGPSKLAMRRRWRAALLTGTFAAVALPTRAENEADPVTASPAEPASDLAPVPTEKLRRRAPSPQWDVGLLAGVCGVGQQRLWATTEFCGGALVDVLFLRRRASDWGVGPYAQLTTSGLADFRASVGALAHVPLGPLSLGGRAGGYVHTGAEGAAPGAEGFLELGLRNLNETGHYALTHTLLTGVQHTPGSLSRAGTTIWIALRIDGFWLAAPMGAVF